MMGDKRDTLTISTRKMNGAGVALLYLLNFTCEVTSISFHSTAVLPHHHHRQPNTISPFLALITSSPSLYIFPLTFLQQKTQVIVSSRLLHEMKECIKGKHTKVIYFLSFISPSHSFFIEQSTAIMHFVHSFFLYNQSV